MMNWVALPSYNIKNWLDEYMNDAKSNKRIRKKNKQKKRVLYDNLEYSFTEIVTYSSKPPSLSSHLCYFLFLLTLVVANFYWLFHRIWRFVLFFKIDEPFFAIWASWYTQSFIVPQFICVFFLFSIINASACAGKKVVDCEKKRVIYSVFFFVWFSWTVHDFRFF